MAIIIHNNNNLHGRITSAFVILPILRVITAITLLFQLLPWLLYASQGLIFHILNRYFDYKLENLEVLNACPSTFTEAVYYIVTFALVAQLMVSLVLSLQYYYHGMALLKSPIEECHSEFYDYIDYALGANCCSFFLYSVILLIKITGTSGYSGIEDTVLITGTIIVGILLEYFSVTYCENFIERICKHSPIVDVKDAELAECPSKDVEKDANNSSTE